MTAAHNFVLASLLMLISMLLWGSWPNLLKVTKGVRFEIFYTNFVLGSLICSAILLLIFAPWSAFDLSSLESSIGNSFNHILRSFLSGAVFSIAYLLLVAAAAFAGISYAFIACFGVALTLDTFVYSMIEHFRLPFLFSAGSILVALSILLITIPQKRIPHRMPLAKKTLTLAILAGISLGVFYPLLERAIDVDSSQRLPFSLETLFFSLGLFITASILNPIFMKKPIFGHPLNLETFQQISKKNHLLALLAGTIWSIGFALKILSEGSTSYIITFIATAGAPFITFLWGIFLWKEVPACLHLTKYILFGALSYLIGMTIIGISRFA